MPGHHQHRSKSCLKNNKAHQPQLLAGRLLLGRKAAWYPEWSRLVVLMASKV
jgi:hypothetical protein